jgi:hypothetical protein
MPVRTEAHPEILLDGAEQSNRGPAAPVAAELMFSMRLKAERET